LPFSAPIICPRYRPSHSYLLHLTISLNGRWIMSTFANPKHFFPNPIFMETLTILQGFCHTKLFSEMPAHYIYRLKSY
jgi:hypothetical protein